MSAITADIKMESIMKSITCSVPERPLVGHGEQRTGCNVPFHFADRSRNHASVRNWNVIRYPWGCLAVIQIETRASRPQKR